MMRIKRMAWMVIAGLFLCGTAGAAMFTWVDADGSYHAVDRPEKLPPKYAAIVRYGTDNFVTPEGIGFERDQSGNFKFFDHTSPGKKVVTHQAPVLDGAPGSPVSPQQLAMIKQRYLEWGGEPRPQVSEAKVKRIITGDTFELDDGQKVTYIGIEFPEELKGDTRIHKEAVEYQKKLMQGRTVHLIYGPQRQDEKGRVLACVFVGKDLFVNADLVMNGYARVHTIPPNTEYKSLFLRLQGFAKNSMLGMWDKGSAPAAPTEK